MSTTKNIPKEYGDFQTPMALAARVTKFLSEFLPAPDVVLEPTAGVGNFIAAAHEVWGNAPTYLGYEVNDEYVTHAMARFAECESISIVQRDFFSVDWRTFYEQHAGKRILILGNPPWVTNASLGALNSENLPTKSNFQGLRGFDAKTGKANFDIAEWILIELLSKCRNENTSLAMLCKTATARKVLRHFWSSPPALGKSSIYLFDAKKEFNVAVDACLLTIAPVSEPSENCASVYTGFSNSGFISRFGLHKGELISDLDAYLAHQDLDGISSYQWRSGIKHDASSVMEFTLADSELINGFGEKVDIEDEFLFPLLKSSDIANGRIAPRKRVLVTQTRVGEETETIADKAPKTWKYLCEHADKLDARRSSIYKNKSRFAMFGIGEYSFSHWKVAISGLYKTVKFLVVPPCDGKPTMLDDTCYFIPCRTEDEADFWANQLNSAICQSYLRSLVFLDAKRPISVDILRRISFRNLASRNGVAEQAVQYLEEAPIEPNRQAHFAFEEKAKYTSRAK